MCVCVIFYSKVTDIMAIKIQINLLAQPPPHTLHGIFHYALSDELSVLAYTTCQKMALMFAVYFNKPLTLFFDQNHLENAMQ